MNYRNIHKNEIHLYSLIIPENFEGFSLKTCAAYLSEGDVAKYSKLRFREKQKELLVSRVFLWNVLERYLPSKPSSINFYIRKDTNGKPFLFSNNERFPLYFNLSHTKGLISCVVSLHHPIGIDVEYIDHQRSQFIEEYLSCVEKEKLRDTQSDNATYLYELWTLKEAYLKADGRGLYVPLDSFGFTFDEKKKEDKGRDRIRIHFYDATEEKEAGQWSFRIYRPTRRHCLAVAVRMGNSPLLRSVTFALDDLNFS